MLHSQLAFYDRECEYDSTVKCHKKLIDIVSACVMKIVIFINI